MHNKRVYFYEIQLLLLKSARTLMMTKIIITLILINNDINNKHDYPFKWTGERLLNCMGLIPYIMISFILCNVMQTAMWSSKEQKISTNNFKDKGSKTLTIVKTKDHQQM